MSIIYLSLNSLEMTWYTVGLSGLSMRAMRDMGYLGVE
jgi:hypothetical protein